LHVRLVGSLCKARLHRAAWPAYLYIAATRRMLAHAVSRAPARGRGTHYYVRGVSAEAFCAKFHKPSPRKRICPETGRGQTLCPMPGRWEPCPRGACRGPRSPAWGPRPGRASPPGARRLPRGRLPRWAWPSPTPQQAHVIDRAGAREDKSATGSAPYVRVLYCPSRESAGARSVS
jgi:hypothetical protein